ncbi:MAG: COX15/CtaA family protein [Rhodospirillales bacterium]|nr:COX15/CtaA family protein [Rhodospirillales bacterium]
MSIATPLPAAATPAAARSLRPVALWLFVCAAMVFAMVVIGGITRLTESGLSIVEWKPLIGAIPPLSEADWQALFAKYQTSPQYHQVNRSMTVDEFKTIFWWEYIHRLWGRLIGAVFLLPFLWFLARGQIRGTLAAKLGGIFLLGGLQGAMGWYMVASGLVDRPEVSQYRLVAHLGLAVLIYALLFWQGMRLWREASPNQPPLPLREGVGGRGPAAASGASFASSSPNTHRPLPLFPSLEGRGDRSALRLGASLLLALVALTMLAGGFVAGLDAGMIYNTFPLMEGRLVPPDYGLLQPWWHDWFENRATVQFHHRVLAIATLAAILLYAWRARPSTQPGPIRRATIATVHLALLQVALGIATLLLVVPVTLGAAHQAGAMVLLTSALWLQFELRG